MKKIFLFCLLIAFVFAFSSCNEASHNTDPQEEGVINVDNGSLNKSLSSMKAGDELSFRMGSEGTLNLSGVNLDSLFSVEFEGGNAKGTSRGMSGGNSEISRVDEKGPFILIPQASGEVSFSGADLGASIDDGTVKLKKIGNDLRNGQNYVEYDVLPTEIDYREEGYPDYLHPTYQNYIRIDFNTPQWSPLKDKKVVIMQNMFFDSPLVGSYTANYMDKFGLLENGKVVYSTEIRGLYDLSTAEDDTLNLYTFLRASKVEGDHLVFRTYLLVPEDVTDKPLDIVGYPHVFKFAPNDKNKKYEIRLSNIPKDYFEQVVTNLFQGEPRYTDGNPVGKPLWIKDISINTEDDKNMDAVLIFTSGIDKEFIINSYGRIYAEPDTVFGKISMGPDETSWKVNDINLEGKESYSSGEISLGGTNPIFHSIKFNNPTNDNYTLTISNSSGRVYLMYYTGRGQGSRGIDRPIRIEPGDKGHFTLFTFGEEATISYQLTKN